MTRSLSEVAGVIVAGGRNRRMGLEKTMLAHEKETILDRTVRVLNVVFSRILIVTDRRDRFHHLRHVSTIVDLIPGIGPLGGIYTALREADPSSVFVVACDMPSLDPAVFRDELRVWSTVEADALVPALDGRCEPLHAIYSPRCLLAISKQIERGDYSMRAFLRVVRTHFWQPDPSHAKTFCNVNTPDDWTLFTNSSLASSREAAT